AEPLLSRPARVLHVNHDEGHARGIEGKAGVELRGVVIARRWGRHRRLVPGHAILLVLGWPRQQAGRLRMEASMRRPVRSRPSVWAPSSLPLSAMTLPRRSVITGQPSIAQPSHGL